MGRRTTDTENDVSDRRKAPREMLRWEPMGALPRWERNPNRHPDSQVEHLAASLRRFGFVNPVVVVDIEEEGVSEVRAGHGRLLALERVLSEDPAWTPRNAPSGAVPGDVPVRRVSLATRAEADAYGVGDNRLAELAEMDVEALSSLLGDLTTADVSLDGLGWDDAGLQALLAEEKQEEARPDEVYTRKIKAPIYEPKGDRPEIDVLYDDEKTRALVEQIDAAALPEDVSAFLRLAAQRHTAFHYQRIAEFYCHASPEVQRLMESSALVIIDFDRAIEEGFVKLTKRLGELADIEVERKNDA